jgi:ribosomal protein S18 acetylase RimI-like enzyme
VTQDGGVKLEVRRVTADDWVEYRRLRLEALQDSPLAFVEQYHESVVQPESFWQERVGRSIEGTTSAMFVAEVAGTLVGKASCFLEPDGVSAHIVGVYVTPGLRGQGVADAVVRAAMAWAGAEAGASRIRLFVTEANERALAFYRRLGFAPTGITMAYPPDPRITEYELETITRSSGRSE